MQIVKGELGIFSLCNFKENKVSTKPFLNEEENVKLTKKVCRNV